MLWQGYGAKSFLFFNRYDIPLKKQLHRVKNIPTLWWRHSIPRHLISPEPSTTHSSVDARLLPWRGGWGIVIHLTSLWSVFPMSSSQSSTENMMKLLVPRPQRSPQHGLPTDRNFRSISWSQYATQLHWCAAQFNFWPHCLELMAIHNQNAGCGLAEGHRIPHTGIFWVHPQMSLDVSRSMWNEPVVWCFSLSNANCSTKPITPVSKPARQKAALFLFLTPSAIDSL